MDSSTTVNSEAYKAYKAHCPTTLNRRSSGLLRTSKRCAVTGVSNPPSPQSDSYKPSAKRKRTHETNHFESPHKKNHIHGTVTPSSSAEEVGNHPQYGGGIDWKDYFGAWPPFAGSMSDHRAKKRSRSQSRSCYSQSVRDGDSPAAWTRQHEEKMQEAGLIMTDYRHRAAITDECRQLCESLLGKAYPLPDSPDFQLARLTQVLERVRYRNEARVVRDVLPIVVPSPELLHVDGHACLSHICEAITAEWTQCDTLCGPRPKPDFVVGISPLAFADEEKDKLRLNHTSACPNIFPENMYFPFLVCEVKGSDRPLIEAERQAMHSTSIAVHAIIQLYRKASLTSEIDQKILAFSIAHDDSNVKIFGHFAKVEADKITYFRHRLFSSDFATDLSSGEWTKAYQITRAIYEYFYPKHLARVKRALSNMRGPSSASSTSQLGLEGDSQNSTAEFSPQEDDPFKIPSLPSTAKLQQDLRNSRRQLDQQKEESQEQKAMLERQITQQTEQLERQLAQQKEEWQEQKAMLVRQMAQQKEQVERQLAQQDEIIRLLRDTRPN